MPYIGKPSVRLNSCIQKQKVEDKMLIGPAFKTTKLGLCFNLKATILFLSKSDVTRKFICTCDKVTSLFEDLLKRIRKDIVSWPESAVFDYVYQCTECHENGGMLNV